MRTTTLLLAITTTSKDGVLRNTNNFRRTSREAVTAVASVLVFDTKKGSSWRSLTTESSTGLKSHVTGSSGGSNEGLLAARVVQTWLVDNTKVVVGLTVAGIDGGGRNSTTDKTSTPNSRVAGGCHEDVLEVTVLSDVGDVDATRVACTVVQASTEAVCCGRVKITTLTINTALNHKSLSSGCVGSAVATRAGYAGCGGSRSRARGCGSPSAGGSAGGCRAG